MNRGMPLSAFILFPRLLAQRHFRRQRLHPVRPETPEVRQPFIHFAHGRCIERVDARRAHLAESPKRR